MKLGRVPTNTAFFRGKLEDLSKFFNSQWERWFGDAQRLINDPMLQLHEAAADPTTSDIETNTGMIWKNTTANEVRLWVNDNGTMKKSGALT